MKKQATTAPATSPAQATTPAAPIFHAWNKNRRISIQFGADGVAFFTDCPAYTAGAICKNGKDGSHYAYTRVCGVTFTFDKQGDELDTLAETHNASPARKDRSTLPLEYMSSALTIDDTRKKPALSGRKAKTPPQVVSVLLSVNHVARLLLEEVEAEATEVDKKTAENVREAVLRIARAIESGCTLEEVARTLARIDEAETARAYYAEAVETARAYYTRVLGLSEAEAEEKARKDCASKAPSQYADCEEWEVPATEWYSEKISKQ